MIQEFSIENTFSIKTRQTISFEAADDTDDLHCIKVGGKKLLKLAAIYGANASGKSNVIRAYNSYMQFILLAFTYLKPKDKTKFTPFAFDASTRKQPGKFDIIFYIEQVKYEYSLVLDSKCVHNERLTYYPKGQSKLLFERKCLNGTAEWENLRYDWKWGDSFVGSKNQFAEMTRQNVSFLNTSAQLKHPVMGKVYNYFQSIYLPVITSQDQGLRVFTIEKMEGDEKVKTGILKLMSKIDIGSINDIIVKDIEVPNSIVENSLSTEWPSPNSEGKYILKEIQFSHSYEKDFILPIFEESNGTQRFFELAGPLMEVINGSKFLCIDEIDYALHEDLLEFFITTFLSNSERSQLLFTTHNQDLLDSDLLVDDEIWFVEKDKTGDSEFFSLIEFKDVPEGVSRRKLYKAGAFGAKPFIFRYFKD